VRVLIVARTRQGAGACIGGIAEDGRSVRLVAPPPAHPRAGLEYEIGDVWEIEGGPPVEIIPPHVENIEVRRHQRVRTVPEAAVIGTIEQYMPAHTGGLEVLYEGLVQATARGSLYVAEAGGVPACSTLFWRPDRPLRRDELGKRIHYVYPADDGPRLLAFVGFQEPVLEIPAGTLVRVSLAHWWRPPDRAEAELRCHLQVSGWFGLTAAESLAPEPASPEAAAAAPVDLTEARAALERVWGYREFRPLQEAVIGAVLAGRDALAVMPTGAGKSLCYQLPAVLREGLTVVVSPLISLMQDQVDQLRAAGVPAVFLNSSLTHAQHVEAARRVRAGEVRLLYLAPETLLRPETLVLLEQSRVALLVVDEAHCISEWGHDFRPEYRKLGPMRARFAGATCLALTATATARVREDIRRQLRIPAEAMFVAPFDRPNLYLEVRPRGGGWEQVRDFVAERRDRAGIVYCSTRDQVDRLVTELGKAGLPALPYHAGLDDGTRRANQRAFIRDETPLVVATVAFGMGINKPDVRYVLHAALPDCLETYYQQVGRAGRDGLPVECLLLHAPADRGTIQHLIMVGAPAERAGRNARFQAMVRYAEGSRCRRALLLPYFGDPEPAGPCGACDNCAAEARGRERVDVTADARIALECVRQIRPAFGATHVVEVLRGSRAQPVLKRGHERLPSHGAGKHRDRDSWRRLLAQLVEQGLLSQDMEHGTLHLTGAGRSLLDGEGAVWVVAEPVAPAGRRERARGPVFEALRAVRRRLAHAAGVAPFVVFSDRTLEEMAAARPVTLEDLRRVDGVGEHKAATYGAAFLEALAALAGAPPDPPAPPPAPAAEPGGPGPRALQVGTMFQQGLCLPDIAVELGIAEDTALSHLVAFRRAGGALDAARVLAESRLEPALRDRALAALAEHGLERLKPAWEALDGEAPYRELHLLRLYLQSTPAASAESENS